MSETDKKNAIWSAILCYLPLMTQKYPTKILLYYTATKLSEDVDMG